MNNKIEGTNEPKIVYIVSCYGNIVGVYAKSEDASTCAKGFIMKGKPADVLARPIL